MTKKQLIEALMKIEGNPKVFFRFVEDEDMVSEDDEPIDADCPVEFVYLKEGEIYLSDTDPEEDDDGEDADETIIEGEVVNG